MENASLKNNVSNILTSFGMLCKKREGALV